MNFRQLQVGLALFTTIFSVLNFAQAQSVPIATQQLQLSAFAAGTGAFTDLDGGRNRDITAGADLTFLTFLLIKPSLEVRGTYPIDKGQIASQKNFLVGPKVEYPLGRLHPYADLFFGRGEIAYNNFIVGEVQYLSSSTSVFSPGIGVDYDLTHQVAVKADFQDQHWDTPASISGSISPRTLTLGAVYAFDFNRNHRHSW